MRDRDAFGIALQTLRQRLRDGVYPSGAPLTIIELAQEFRVSATPVREALARLAGEGLVEERRGWGYCTWRLDREGGEELYRLHKLYVELALGREGDRGSRGLAARLQGAIIDAELPEPHALRSATEAVFAQVVEGGCQPAGIGVHRSVRDRLAPLRLAEAQIFDDAQTELRTLAVALDAGDGRDCAEALAAYHQKRLEAISTILRNINKMSRPAA